MHGATHYTVLLHYSTQSQRTGDLLPTGILAYTNIDLISFIHEKDVVNCSNLKYNKSAPEHTCDSRAQQRTSFGRVRVCVFV